MDIYLEFQGDPSVFWRGDLRVRLYIEARNPPFEILSVGRENLHDCSVHRNKYFHPAILRLGSVQASSSRIWSARRRNLSLNKYVSAILSRPWGADFILSSAIHIRSGIFKPVGSSKTALNRRFVDDFCIKFTLLKGIFSKSIVDVHCLVKFSDRIKVLITLPPRISNKKLIINMKSTVEWSSICYSISFSIFYLFCVRERPFRVDLR